MRTNMKNKSPEYLSYKGMPLIRSGNLIYYGNMEDSHIIVLEILESKNIKDLAVATKVSVQLRLTDRDVKTKDRVVKKTEKEGLYEALDIGVIWLSRALSPDAGESEEQ